MKQTTWLLFAAMLFLACKSSVDKRASELPEYTIIAEDSMEVKLDSLNHYFLKVNISSTARGSGRYEVTAFVGENKGHQFFSMPRGGEAYIPVLKRDRDSNRFVVGFYLDNDPKFYPYYKIQAGNNAIEMRYLKAYAFE